MNSATPETPPPSPHFAPAKALVLAGVCALLTAILLPVLQRVAGNREASKQGLAANLSQELRKACSHYQRILGPLPGAAAPPGPVDGPVPEDRFKLILRALLAPGPSRTPFLELAQTPKDGLPRDPWGQPFLLFLDENHDGFVDVGSTRLPSPSGALCLSLGPNRCLDVSPENQPGDDIGYSRAPAP